MLKEHGVTGAINAGDDRAHRSGTRFLNVAYPDALTLGLWERGTVIASLAIPAKAGVGEEREGLIWVRGDRDHVLRWTVRVTAHAGNCCHQVDVADCPDLVHHWYVHFYCERPGSGGSR